MRQALCLLLLSSPLCSPLLADRYPRQTSLDVLHYSFRVSLSDTEDRIEGETRIDLRFLSDAVNEVFLDLTSVLSGKGMTLQTVREGNAALRFEHKYNRLKILFPAPPRNCVSA